MFCLQLYSTSGCHLCDDAKQLLSELQNTHAVQWREVEIADSDELITQYGVRIPVVRHVESGEELGWPFDQRTLADWLEKLRKQTC